MTAATGDQSFVDPAGDANGAPDVTGVTISSDYATKMVDLTVKTVTRSASFVIR